VSVLKEIGGSFIQLKRVGKCGRCNFKEKALFLETRSTVGASLNGHQAKLKNDDTSILHEVDVIRTVHVACNLRANSCSFFELCNEA
jgi:hypothetical protein